MKKKIVIIASVLSIVFNSVLGSLAFAAPTAEDSRWSVVSKLKGLETSLNNTYDGQDGLYYNLYYLSLKVQWINLILDFNKTNGLDFTPQEKTYYWSELVTDFKNFNMRFEKTASTDPTNIGFFDPLKLYVSGNQNDSKAMMTDFTNNTVPNYLKAKLTKILSEYKSATSEDEKDTVITTRKADLRYVYKILDVLLFENTEMQSLLPQDATLYVPGSPNGKLLWTSTDFSDLLAKGKAFSIDEARDLGGLTDVADANYYLERLAWVKKKTASNSSDSDLGSDNWAKVAAQGASAADEFKLRDTYVRMFAASAVYRPLVSHVGDADFLASLASLYDDDVSATMLQLYDEVKDFRKPIYAMYDSSKWYNLYDTNKSTSNIDSSVISFTGKANLITLKEFMKSIKDETLIGLTMHKGKLGVSKEDTNTYSYFNDNPRFDKLTADVQTIYTPTVVPTPDPLASPDPNATAAPDPNAAGTSTGTTSVAGDLTNDVLTIATEEVTSTKFTSAIVEVGGLSNSSMNYPTAGLSLAAFKNYFKNFNYFEGMKDSDDSFLFMNAFGDIVTKDNLVVVPGSANPMFYNQEKGYFPYNVMFMTGYPGISTRDNSLTLGSDQDKGKYMLISGGDSYGKSASFAKVTGKNSAATHDPRLTFWVNLSLAEKITGVGNPFTLNEFPDKFTGIWDSLKLSIGALNYFKSYDFNENKLLYKEDVAVNGSNVMNYDPSTDTDYKVAKYIGRNMYLSFKDAASNGLSGRLREDFLFSNIMVEAMNGTIYASGYSKVLTETVDKMSNDAYNFFTKFIRDAGEAALEGMGNVDGVLGIKKIQDDELFGKIVTFINKFFLYIVLIILVLFIFQFMRNNATLPFTVMSSVLVIAGSFFFLQVVPNYLPTVYNSVVGMTNEKLSYNILYTKSEKYFKTYRDSGTMEDNKFKMATTSVDLYHLSKKDLQSIQDKYNLTEGDLSEGKMSIVDSYNGLFLQGSTLKLNTDTLLATNPITGSYVDTEYGTAYQLTSDKMFTSVIDYYMPYYLVEDGFVDTLNRLLTMYNIPKYSVSYGDGLNKDSYIIYNYINSRPFLTPGNYSQEDGLITGPELDKLQALFDNPDIGRFSKDFLGLTKLFSNITPEMEESLWYKSMVANGVDPRSTEEEDKKKVSELISSVNYGTKEFMLDLKTEGGVVSDENMIKIISLYATTLFNDNISTMKNNVYPKNLNYEEIKLKDAFLTVFTQDYMKFIQSDRDVMSYMHGTVDGFTFSVLLLDIYLATFVSIAIQLSLPLLYMMLMALVILRYSFGSKVNAAIYGYAKTSLIIFGSLTVFVTTLGLRSGKSPTATVWILFFELLIIFSVLLVVVLSILMDPATMGNNQLSVILKKVAGKIPPMKWLAEKLNVKSTDIRKTSAESEYVRDRQRRFRTDASPNEYLSELSPDRSYLSRGVERSLHKKQRKAYLFKEEENLARKARESRENNDFKEFF